VSTQEEAPRGSARFRSPLVRWGPYLLLAVVLVVALAVGASRTPGKNLSERTQAIAATIKCPQCTDESMATSNAPTSVAGRAEIARRLRAGQTSAQIRAFFASRYGDTILLTPKSTGFDSLIWILPVIVLVVGFAGLTAAFLRWRRLTPTAPTADDHELVDEARHRTSEEES
jgi:cytochrome c-type biogenesis protein CcmH